MDRWEADPNQKGERLGKFVGENIPGLAVGAGAGALAARGGLAAANALGTTGTLGKVAGAIESPFGRFATRTVGETLATTPMTSGSDNKPVTAGDFAGNLALNAVLDPTAYKAARNTSFGKAIGGFKDSSKGNTFFDETADTIYNRTRPAQEIKMDKTVANSLKTIMGKSGVKRAGEASDFLTGDWMGTADVIPGHLTPEEYGLVQFSREMFKDNADSGIKFISRPMEGDVIIDSSNTIRSLANKEKQIGSQMKSVIGDLSSAPTHSQDDLTDFDNISSFIDNFNKNKATATPDIPAADIHDKMQTLVDMYKMKTRTNRFAPEDFQNFSLKQLFDMKSEIDNLDGAGLPTKIGLKKIIDNAMLQSAERSGGQEAKDVLQNLMREFSKTKDFMSIAETLKEKIVTRDAFSELGGIMAGSLTGSFPAGILVGAGARVGNNKAKAKTYSSLFSDKSTGFTKAYRKDVAKQAATKEATNASKLEAAKKTVDANAEKLKTEASFKRASNTANKTKDTSAADASRAQAEASRKAQEDSANAARVAQEKKKTQEAAQRRKEQMDSEKRRQKAKLDSEKRTQSNKIAYEREKAKLAIAKEKAKTSERIRLEKERTKNKARDFLKEALTKNKKSTPK